MAKRPPTRTATRGSASTKKMSAERPPPAVPGVGMPFSSYPPVDNTSQQAQIANSRDALAGVISYAAGPTLTRYSTYPADGISAEMIKAAMRNADLGYPRIQAEMYEQLIERDAHLRGVAKARIYEVSGKQWFMRPLDETPLAASIAKFCRAAVDEIDGFDSDIDDLLWANGNGYAASEIVWRFDDLRFPDGDGNNRLLTAFVPRSLEWVHAKHFEFDAITDEPYLFLASGRIRLPKWKFVFHPAADTGEIERRGYMRPCMTLCAAKAWALRDWLLYEGLFAVPQVTGTYPADKEEYEKQRGVYQQIMRDWGKGVPAFIADDIEFKISPAQTGGNSSGVHAAILGYCNQEMSKLIQGETLTTEVGNVGAYAATETHADVRHAFIRADALKLAQTLRRDLLTPIVEVNLERLATLLGATPREIMRCIPKMQWRIDRETSPTQRKDIIIAFANAGLSIDEDAIRDEFALDPPKPGGKALRGEPVTVSAGGAAIGSAEASDGITNPKPEETPAPSPGEKEITNG